MGQITIKYYYNVLEQFEDAVLGVFESTFVSDLFRTLFYGQAGYAPVEALTSLLELEEPAFAPFQYKTETLISIIDLVIGFYFLLIFVMAIFIRFSSSVFSSLYTDTLFKLTAALKNLLLAQAGPRSEPFLPLLFSLFLFILCSNLFGLIPFWFCLTSQFYFTILLSFSMFFGLTIFGFKIQSYHFLALFVPQNVPSLLLPFLILIEVISYLSRAISLAVRLFANMVAGHVLLHILMGLCLVILKGVQNLLILPVIVIFLVVLGAILTLEIGIAFLQAYVFVVLCAIYLNDSLTKKAH